MKPFARLLQATAVMTTLALAPAAMAQGRTVQTPDYVERSMGGDQVVTFTGDELPVDPGGWFGTSIRPLPGATRVGLIRPRLNFVPELLKSVENL